MWSRGRESRSLAENMGKAEGKRDMVFHRKHKEEAGVGGGRGNGTLWVDSGCHSKGRENQMGGVAEGGVVMSSTVSSQSPSPNAFQKPRIRSKGMGP